MVDLRKCAENAFKCLEVEKNAEHKFAIVYDTTDKTKMALEMKEVAKNYDADFLMICADDYLDEMKSDVPAVVKRISDELHRFYGKIDHSKINCVTFFGGKDTSAILRREVVGIILGEFKGYDLHVVTDDFDVVERLLSVDPFLLLKRGQRLKAVLDKCDKIMVTTTKGTSFAFDWDGKKRNWVISSGLVRRKSDDKSVGMWGNPGGEVFTAPMQETVYGRLIVDGSIGDYGKVKEAEFIVREGRALLDRIKAPKKIKDYALAEMGKDPDMGNMSGEFGIGITPGIDFVGDLLQDEKIEGTIHLAFGDPEADNGTGGEYKSKAHMDCVLREPTVEVRIGKDWKTIIKNGKFVVKIDD